MKYKYNLYLKYLILILFIINVEQVNSKEEVGITEKLSEYIPGDIWLVNETGDTVNLLSEITLPTVLSFVYYNCPGICSPLMNEIKSIIDKSDLVLGKDYQVLTISFNPKENTQLAVDKKNNYLKEMAKAKNAKNWWKFYTGDSINIAKATESVGFYYQKAGNEFVHKTALIIINREGKIIRYNHGIELLPLELKISVAEANKSNPLPASFKKDEYCYPYTVTAYVKLHKLAKVTGLIILFLAIGLFLTLILKPKLIKK